MPKRLRSQAASPADVVILLGDSEWRFPRSDLQRKSGYFARIPDEEWGTTFSLEGRDSLLPQ